jgi:hypothetical protein
MTIAVVVAGSDRAADARTIRAMLADVAPDCAVSMHAFDAAALSEGSPGFARCVAAALSADAVLFVAPVRDARTNAGLIALRERSGFTKRFSEPEFARAWFTADGRRSLYVVGVLPGAFAAVNLALELGNPQPALH